MNDLANKARASFGSRFKPVLRKYGLAARLALKNRLAYPAEFLSPLLTFSLIVFVLLQVWAQVFRQNSLIAGFDYKALVWYFLSAELVIFATSSNFFQFSAEIKNGQIAYALGKPYSVYFYAWIQRYALALLQALVLLPVGFCLGFLNAGLPLLASPWQFFLGPLSFLLGIAIQLSAHLLLGLSAFWLEENSALYWIWAKLALVLGALLPVEFLPETWQPWILFSPFPWITWVPGRLCGAWPGLEKALSYVLVQGVLASALIFFGLGVFSRAREKLSLQGG